MDDDLISLHALLGGSKTPDLKNKELTLLTDYFLNTKTNDLYIKHASDGSLTIRAKVVHLIMLVYY